MKTLAAVLVVVVIFSLCGFTGCSNPMCGPVVWTVVESGTVSHIASDPQGTTVSFVGGREFTIPNDKLEGTVTARVGQRCQIEKGKHKNCKESCSGGKCKIRVFAGPAESQ